VRDYAVDTNEFISTGLSMGGFGTWDLGLTYRKSLRLLCDLRRGTNDHVVLSSREKPRRLETLGVWAFTEPKIRSFRSKNPSASWMAKEVGVKDVKFTIYPDAATTPGRSLQ